MDRIKDKAEVSRRTEKLRGDGIISEKEYKNIQELLANDDCKVVFTHRPLHNKNAVTGQEFEFNIALKKVIGE